LSNLLHLGCKGRIVSVIGDDKRGDLLCSVAQKHGVDVSGLIVSNDRPTIVKTRFLAGHQQLLRTDYERVMPVSRECRYSLLEKVQEAMDGVRAVILSDYGKGLLVPELIKELIALAQARGIPVLVDPKNKNFSVYAGADVVTPNKKELGEATGGLQVETDEQISKAASHLIKACGIKAVVATRSKDGMSVVRKTPSGENDSDINFDTTHIRSAEDIEVFDVSGAGDTVIATIAAAIGAGADVVKAASLANIAGSIVVSKVGTAPIRSEELIDYLVSHDVQDDLLQKQKRGYLSRMDSVCQAPVMTWQEAKEEVLRWKARGMKVGFTNGCFDILHFGHVTYLNDARQRCDRLIVGLNKDASIRLLKGDDRPVHDENSRARVMSALGAVDMVVLFGAEKAGDDNTPCALVSEIQPDIFFKGGDYTIDKLPEAPIVMSYGGQVEIMPVYEGHSTTKSIQRIRA